MTSNEKTNTILRKRLVPLLLVYGVMVVLALIANVVSPGFLALNHLLSVLRQVAFLGIVCIGQTMVILTGGIDLSITYTLVLSNVVCAQAMNGDDANLPKTIVIALGIGLAAGTMNTFGICVLKIPAMIMTLASGSVMYGISYIYCGGSPKGKASPAMSEFANGKLFGFLNGVTLFWIIASIIIIVVLKKTVFGRSVYAVGVNPESARYSGIKVPMVLFSVYVISSVMAALDGAFLVGYTGTSYLSTGASYNMDSIAAVVVGGTAITGGAGGYVGTIAGAAIMTLIDSLMTVLNMAESGKKIIQGLLVIALLVGVYGRKKRK
ncbi:MAG: ABC transporter permease [Ruthenibacterium sp.]